VRVWDTRTGKLERQITTSQTSGRLVVLSPDGMTLATSGTGKAINLCDIRTGNVLRTLQGHAHPAQSVAFSADGRILVSGGDYRTTKVWEVATGRLLATLVTFSESQRGTMTDDWLAHTPDGFYDGSPGIDRYLAWWFDDELQTPATLGPRLHRPDRVAAILQLSLPKTD
jgi:WD40 repeat protein